MKQEITNTPKKTNVVVQHVNNSTGEVIKINVANGQQKLIQASKDQSGTNKFVLTPDYIQQSK